MPSPTKAITYLNGAYPRSSTVFKAVDASPSVRLKARSIQMLPPFWRRVTFTFAAPSSRVLVISKKTYRIARIAMKTTIFWRNRGGRPLRGQLWPRTR